MGILFAKLGDIAEILERKEEADSWHQRADEIIKKMIDTFWNGKKFIALANHTHEVIDSNAITDYLPFVLGDLLPQEIIDKMTEDLLVEGDFLSPVGLTTEKISSDQFRRAGFSRGYALPPSNLMVLTGMYMAGKKEEAKMIAKRFCESMITSGISQLMDPIEQYRITFSCTWPACGFLALADMAYNM
jgi:glycogen debranching enzyme